METGLVMADEFRIEFSDLEWYKSAKNELSNFVGSLPTFIQHSGPDVSHLCEKPSNDTWGYDARIFFQASDILLEISGSSKLVNTDLRRFVAHIRSKTLAETVDEDGMVVDFFG